MDYLAELERIFNEGECPDDCDYLLLTNDPFNTGDWHYVTAECTVTIPERCPMLASDEITADN